MTIRRHFARALFSVAVIVIPRAPGATSEFDCAKAAAPMDFVICSSPQIQAANDEMVEAWRAAREELNEAGRIALVRDQRAWMGEVSRECGLPAQGRPSHDIIAAAQSCVLRKISERPSELINAATRFSFSHEPATIEMRCAPESGEASIRIASDEDAQRSDDDVPDNTRMIDVDSATKLREFPLTCQLVDGHRLTIERDIGGSGPLSISADDILVGTVGYTGNHVTSIDDAYFSAKLERDGQITKFIVEEVANGSKGRCATYSLIRGSGSEQTDHPCDPRKMPPLHLH